MIKRFKKSGHKCRQAFTLVEMIVVFVILAIIAAVLVPALTEYIRRAKRERYYGNAHTALVASQSVMTELYAKGGITAQDLSSAGRTSDGNNINWFSGSNKEWGDEVLELMGRDRSTAPSIMVVGVGYTPVSNPDKETKTPYTVYYLAYLENDKGDRPGSLRLAEPRRGCLRQRIQYD